MGLLRARAIAQLVEYLPCKHEALGLILRPHLNKQTQTKPKKQFPCVAVHTYDPSTGPEAAGSEVQGHSQLHETHTHTPEWTSLCLSLLSSGTGLCYHIQLE